MNMPSHLLSTVNPPELWDHFYQISQIPRPSGDERAICQYICSLARNLGLEYEMDTAGGDDYGNIVVRVPATDASRDAPITVIQSHLDMVTLPPERKNEPLDLILDGSVLRAKGSTLGADNGLAVAMSLTLMTNASIVHGPLELLFTIDEEATMSGVRMLSDTFLKGTCLINIDTVGEGVLTLSSAGIGVCSYVLPIVRQPLPKGHIPVQLNLYGGRGGHSGLEIHAGRGNAGQILARILFSLSENLPFRVSDISWGAVINAIPSDAQATLLIPDESLSLLISGLSDHEEQINHEFNGHDGPFHLNYSILPESPVCILSEKSQLNLLSMLTGLHHGIYEMSQEFPGTVETSSNLALVRTEDEQVLVTISFRSLHNASLDSVITRCHAVATLAGADRTSCENHSGWSADPDSSLLAICKEAYSRVYHEDVRLLAIHGTIECGFFKEKYPHMDIISIGTAILDFHIPTSADFLPGRDSLSPGERYDTARMPRFWNFITEILKIIASGSYYSPEYSLDRKIWP